MKKSLFRRATNRLLHTLARTLPGATGLRPKLHRARGMSVGKGVFIGDDVYLENEYPEAIEIRDGVQIAVRSIVLAHTRGAGKIVLENDVFIGANCVISTSGDRALTIGEGAVIGAGVVVTKDVAPFTFLVKPEAIAVAKVGLPLAKAKRMEDFVRALVPIRKPARVAAAQKGATGSSVGDSGGRNG